MQIELLIQLTLATRSNENLIDKSWIRDMLCHVTNDTRASMTIARPNINTKLTKRMQAKSAVCSIHSVHRGYPCFKVGTSGADSGAEQA
jgi:hypothetical protein